MSAELLHSQTHHTTHESLWCPKCNQWGLVYCDHNDEDVWKCVYCSYQVNLTKGTRRSGASAEWKFPWEVIFATFIVLMFLIFAKEFELSRPLIQNSYTGLRSPTFQDLR
ncbi:MAG: hypothetical protein NW224_03905 [Leptolyngbyaceae cyanobacterium bins.302]|nr:hypothetical protein [Leptolyngbyaceae cyanobacterium bins.302]